MCVLFSHNIRWHHYKVSNVQGDFWTQSVDIQLVTCWHVPFSSSWKWDKCYNFFQNDGLFSWSHEQPVLSQTRVFHMWLIVWFSPFIGSKPWTLYIYTVTPQQVCHLANIFIYLKKKGLPLNFCFLAKIPI